MIQLKNVSLLRGTKPVLDGASATLHPGEKVGLIGRNGAGKSSLFSLLAGRLHPDAGDVEIPPSWLQPGGMAEVAQNMPETDEPATEFVLQGDTRLMAARQALAQAEAANDGHAIAEAHMALADAGDFDAPARAQALLLGLGFQLEQTTAPVNSFSGGWRMRLQLARALMCPAQLLLLDEPTNHLDLDALVWLESWLQRYEGTLIIISHDREFLDAITKVTLHLDEGKLTRYTGGYTAFEAMRAERMSQHQAAYDKQQDRIAHLQKFIDRFKAKATKAKVHLVRYADDFVVMCKSREEAEQALATVRQWCEAEGLTVHPTKTRVVSVRMEGFDFLGYHFQATKKGRLTRWPRKKSLMKLKDTIRSKTGRTNGSSLEYIILNINRTLRGWYGYFKHSCRQTFRQIDTWVRGRLRTLMRKRTKRSGLAKGEDHIRYRISLFADIRLFNLTTAHDLEGQSTRG